MTSRGERDSSSENPQKFRIGPGPFGLATPFYVYREQNIHTEIDPPNSDQPAINKEQPKNAVIYFPWVAFPTNLINSGKEKKQR